MKEQDITKFLDSIEVFENEPKDANVLAFTNYSRIEELRRSNGRLYGNWISSFGGACAISGHNQFIYVNSIIRIKEVGICHRTGKQIVVAEHH